MQNLKRVFEMHLYITYRPFYPLLSTPQPYYVYFSLWVDFYNLLQTPVNFYKFLSQLKRVYTGYWDALPYYIHLLLARI